MALRAVRQPSTFALLSACLSSVAAAVILAAVIQPPFERIHSDFFAFGDLRAFYCSGTVAQSGTDPYRAEPLGTCERALVGMRQNHFILPAPLPGHAIALFEPLARLSFSTAAAAWCGLLAATYVILCITLARLAGCSYTLTVWALMPLGLVVPSCQGQLVPIAVTFIVGAALALRERRDAVAALLVAAATIEPHVGLGAGIALFVARPQTRPYLLAAYAALAAIAVHALGPNANLEYLVRVLPEHIASEARFDDQYSLTYLLSWLHVPVPAAIGIGQSAYWLLLGGAIATIVRSTKLRHDGYSLLLVPMACSAAGGPFVHVEHLLAAVPLAVVTAIRARMRPECALALALVGWPAKFVLTVCAVPGIVLHISGGEIAQSSARLPLLAQAGWAARIAPHTGHLLPLLAKIPSWIGLVLLLGVALRVRRAAPTRCRLAPGARVAVP